MQKVPKQLVTISATSFAVISASLFTFALTDSHAERVNGATSTTNVLLAIGQLWTFLLVGYVATLAVLLLAQKSGLSIALHFVSLILGWFVHKMISPSFVIAQSAEGEQLVNAAYISVAMTSVLYLPSLALAWIIALLMRSLSVRQVARPKVDESQND